MNLSGPVVIGNTEAFFYLTLGKLTALVASQPDIQSQFQRILDIGTTKTFQMGEILPHWYSIGNLTAFTGELRMKPLFLMTKDLGEIDGYHVYTMTNS